MHELIDAEPSLSFDYVRSGKLAFHRDANAFAAAAGLLEFQRSLGCEQEALDRDACIQIEPALEHVRNEIAGGIYTASEDTGDCYLFCKGLERVLRARGVAFELGTDVTALKQGIGDRVEAFSGTRRLPGQQVVLAMGCASAKLLKPLGIHVPLYPLKGYSLTVATQPRNTAPSISVTDFARKVVYARLGNRLRIAGMADLVGHSGALNKGRLATLRREAQHVFPEAGDYAAAEEWAGLRPATPRGTPILGATPHKNLWLNIGQGALGFTLATGCAQLLSDWISDKPAAIDQSTFGLQSL
jgi:D-amino-acid dehydrogenase